MKVFFDTNVYLSETLTHGISERAIRTTIGAGWRVFHSEYLLDEIERVLVAQLAFSSRLAKLIRIKVQRRSLCVELASSRHAVPGDAKDTPILQAAIEAKVDILVTNDQHLRELHPYEGMEILNLAEYVRRLENEGLL